MDALLKAHKQIYGQHSKAPYLFSFAPGRINFIGEHVDYLGGCVVPAAINYGMSILMSAEPAKKWTFSCCSVNLGNGKEVVTVTLDETAKKDKSFRTICFGSATEAWKLAKAAEKSDLQPKHIRLVMDGRVPLGAGLSSSAALCVGLINGFMQYLCPEKAALYQGRVTSAAHRAELKLYKRELAKAGRAVENSHCGVNVGIMDQYASVHGQPNTVLKVDCTALEHEAVTLPDAKKAGYRVILINSMRTHNLGEDYNTIRRNLETAEKKITDYLKRHSDDARAVNPSYNGEHVYLKQLVGVKFGSRSATEWLTHLSEKKVLDKGEYDRAYYAVSEMERTNAFVALTKEPSLVRDPEAMLKKLGALLTETHHGLSKKLLVSTEELDKIEELCRAAPGVYGARMMGGGFGGCVLAIISEKKFTSDVRKKLQQDFKKAFPDLNKECTIYDVAISKGAYVQPVQSAKL